MHLTFYHIIQRFNNPDRKTFENIMGKGVKAFSPFYHNSFLPF